jgi:hypothetical protein
MHTTTRIIYGVALVAALASCLTLGGCRKKGPAERAGEKIDDAVEKMEDAIDPKGPAEKAGRAVDDAVDDLKD